MAGARSAGASTTGGHQPGGEQPGHQDKNPAGPLTAAAGALAGLSGTARGGGMDITAALDAITAARSLAAELEHSNHVLHSLARHVRAWLADTAAETAKDVRDLIAFGSRGKLSFTGSSAGPPRKSATRSPRTRNPLPPPVGRI